MSRKIVLAGVVLLIAALGLAAGIALRQFSVPSETEVTTVGDLRIFEKYLRPLNADPGGPDQWEGKVLLLNFWGSWCPPCIAEMPMLDYFNKQYGGDKFQIVGIAVDNEEPARQFLIDNEIEFPSLTGDMTTIDRMIEALGNTNDVLPYSVAFSESGELMSTWTGPLDAKDLLKLVE